MFYVFRKYKALVEKQSGKSLKTLRTDGGFEYATNEMKQFCEEAGIYHEIITPYTPQHNGVDERRNKTISNMVRSMLKSKNLPVKLWGEAVSTATYILNRCPTMKLKSLTPKEAWTRVKPRVEYFRVFGSVCYRHLLD